MGVNSRDYPPLLPSPPKKYVLFFVTLLYICTYVFYFIVLYHIPILLHVTFTAKKKKKKERKKKKSDWGGVGVFLIFIFIYIGIFFRQSKIESKYSGGLSLDNQLHFNLNLVDMGVVGSGRDQKRRSGGRWGGEKYRRTFSERGIAFSTISI